MLTWWSQAEEIRSRGRYKQTILPYLLAFQDTAKTDSSKLVPYIPSRRPTFVPKDRRGDAFSTRPSTSPLLLGQPSNLQLNVELDDSAQLYNITETIGDVEYRTPSSMSMREYSEWQQKEAIRNYWRSKSASLDGESVVSSNRLIPKIYISPVFDKIFGGNYVDIQPNGNVTLKFGARFNRNENPTIPLRQQRTGDFDFEQNISLNLVGKIGEKMRLNFNWDNNANFDFENNMKLDYAGNEENIIRKIEAGNVSLPLNNSLITGAQNLFGVKAQLQFGRLGVTAVAASVRGTNDEVVIQNGNQSNTFEIKIDQYDNNRHYFLSQFFRNRYDNVLKNLPLVNSGVTINRLEVYVTNTNNSTQDLRNMVAYMDLGEPDPYRDQFGSGATAAPANNGANSLYRTIANTSSARNNTNVDQYLQSQGLQKGTDFEHVRARKLNTNEYSFNQQLGYISLNTTLLPDQVLGVAFEYTYNGKTYKVGELMDDYQNLQDEQVIQMKLLKATNPSLNYPTWDLMMKNVYNLNATQVNRDGFQLQLIYKDDETGVDITSLKEESPIQNIPLVEVLNLDNVNTNNDRPSDGNFDFLSGITINPDKGWIFFPQVEPFGDYLQTQLQGYPELIDRYVYQELYEQTQSDAQQNNVKAKFFIKGRYQASSTDEIMLPGFQIAEGSVAVYSGGTLLEEGIDYQVFYDLGRIKILNSSYLSSASDLRVTYEKAELLNIQPRTMLGTRLDYRLNDDINIGATMLHLNEQAYVNRVSIGDEPTNNTIYGFDVNLQKNSRFLTKMVDAIPLIDTKVPSTVTFSGEFAQLVPAKSKSAYNEDGASYIDDFEGAETPYSLGGYNNTSWRLASTPEALAPGAGLAYAYNRAKLAWYTVDQIFYRSSSNLRPSNITEEEIKNHYVRGVGYQEVFPGRDPTVTNTYEYTFDLAYYPHERGQYNYNPALDAQGRLAGDPRDNWGGISRAITFDTDFDNANIEYIEFWMMDPFITGPNGRKDAEGNQIQNNDGGELVFNLGNISEDILKDGQYAFENGLPTNDTELQDLNETIWGRVTTQQFLTNAFSGVTGARQYQDIGLDGLNDASEFNFFQDAFISRIPGVAPQSVIDDPSADNFRHYLDPLYDQQNAGILARYKNYNGMENNSPENSSYANYASPDKEDLNGDNVINDLEQYYEYKISLQPGQLNVGQHYIVDQVQHTAETGETVNWYQFRIPVRQPTNSIGNISGFKSIRFMRMYMTQFADPVVLRMSQFQFVSNQWRTYQQPLTDGTPCLTCTDDARSFTISTVNIEENGMATEGKSPYVLPPGIERIRDYTSTNNRRQNEQSMQLCVEDLKDSFSKAVYKNISLDMLIYKRLKMFVHAESDDPNTNDDDMEIFIRIGTDFTQNFYEYLVPLKLTKSGQSVASEIWPSANEIDIALQDFVDAKVARNSNASYNRYTPYSVPLTDGRTIRVMGNPDFSEVQSIMIGVRNPRKSNDDTRAHSVCVWVDEFRVTDFVNQSGWAANARLNTKLADFANITATGAYTTVGFGGLQQKIASRSRENTAQFDVSANVVADKLLPEKLGIKVPLTVQYSTLNSEPQYDPLDKDVPLEQSLTRFGDDNEAREAYRKEVTTRETRKSISLLNVHKERTDPEAKVRPYDIENLSLSYSYAERLFTDIETDRDYTKSYTGAIAYIYSNTAAKNFTPFDEIKSLNSPYLRLIKDLNFTPLPSSFAVRFDLDRSYNETFLQRRDSETGLITTRGIEPTFQKYFYFNRVYDMKWDITNSLSLDYTATNRSIVDEPDDRINSDIDSLQYKNKVIWNNLMNGGRNTNFNQIIALNYRLPLDKFPLTDWIGAETRYAATYIWTAGSTALTNDSLNLGNTVENNTELSLTGKFDLVKLYNKLKFFRDVNSPPSPEAKSAPNDTTAQNPKPELKVAKALARAFMMTRSVNFTYLQNRGTLLPGYLPSTYMFGLNRGFDAPGLPFVLGKQYELDNLYNRAYNNGWYTDSSQYLNTPLSSIFTETFSARANLEPFRNFNLQVDVSRNKSEIEEVFYRKEVDDYGNISEADQRQNPFNSGSFSTSFMALGTLFESRSNGTSAAFDNFIRYRYNVREQLTAANAAASDSGYTLNSQEVLMKAFLYAYQGRDINGYEAKPDDNPFKRLPIPNWRVDYNGLSQLPFFKRWFSQVNITHAYNSSYNISNYTTSLAYTQQPTGFASQTNEFGQLVPYYIVSQLTVSERLAPLLGINFRTNTNLTGRLEYKVERNLSLNLTNAQVTETSVKDYVIGLGYATSNFRIPFRINGKQTVLDNELTMRLDLSVRDNQTVQRAIAEDDQGTEYSQNQITNGTRQLQLRPTIDYVVSQRVNLQFYVLRTVSDPKISTSFRSSVTEGGVQLRVSLQ
ncbi:cell surface protein SprA [Pontibacter silvestris]|uniref:Cell surface protein SprA n=2 Tax=Pontibacter silvestris TaxID=2305183 RepID=A0ABW4WUS3_9BACT|nr:cell surface protein SprA [Pontibacter silvestris]MCC9136337.1 cell surface protein SprA [Pontibacter silvestris]